MKHRFPLGASVAVAATILIAIIFCSRDFLSTAAAAGITVGFVVGLVAIYFLPTISAAWQNKRATAAICVLNLFLGWTLVGWVVALAWSMVPDDKNS